MRINLTEVELKNYKSHKSFKADFEGLNKLVQGNKGSGKTSIFNAIQWLVTGGMVEDPTPVDEYGEIINNLEIMVRCKFDDGKELKITSEQVWSKNKELKQRHKATYFIDNVPVILKEYQAFLDSYIGTVEQRKILLNPEFFATGDGLAVTSGVRKTAIQRRKEIILDAVGSTDIEAKLQENDDKIVKAKFAITELKKEHKETKAGIEALETTKIDLTGLNYQEIENEIALLEKQKTTVNEQIMKLKQGDSSNDALVKALNDAENEYQQRRAKYIEERSNKVAKAQEPLDAYRKTKSDLEHNLTTLHNQHAAQMSKRDSIERSIIQYTALKKEAGRKYHELEAKVYAPDTTVCPTCTQALPLNQLQAAEANFNTNKSNKMKEYISEANGYNAEIEKLNLQLNALSTDYESEYNKVKAQLNALVEPVIETYPQYEQTDEHTAYALKVAEAKKALEVKDTTVATDVYDQDIIRINNEIHLLQLDLEKFGTNDHLSMSIDAKGIELGVIMKKLDEQEMILENCQEFTKKTLDELDGVIREKFDGIWFKMFEYTLDGGQKDVCVTYAMTDRGLIPWDRLSGGQKRSATIKLANAFSKIWDKHIPLFIDDAQIYVEDEVAAQMQLIRITEVPNVPLEVK